MTWTVQLDPPAVALGDRVMFDLNNGPIRVDQAGIDWGDAAIEAFEAEQMKWGNRVVAYRYPNRQVTLPLFLGGDDSGNQQVARKSLQQKIALFQRDGGWLLRQRAGGSAMYADVVNLTGKIPDVWGETANLEPGVSLTLECLPDFYGDEVVGDVQTATSFFSGVVQKGGLNAVIDGDHPARTRIIVKDTSGNNQNALLWASRSRYYDSAATAALAYEAEALTPVGGAATAVLAGASGGSVVTLANLPAGAWAPMLWTGALTHVGTYGVWARVYAGTGTPSLRFQWGVGSLSNPSTNDPVMIPQAGDFYLVYLGQVRIDPAPIGTNTWYGLVQAYSTPGAESASVDKLFLQPLDDGAGRLVYTSPAAAPPVTAIASGANSPGTGADDSAVGTVAWTNPTNVQAEDGQYASAVLASGITSHREKLTNFGFTIPTGATIVGIQVRFKRWSSGTGNFAVADSQVRIVKGGIVQTTERSAGAQWSRSLGWTDWFGGASDLWGAAWTPADINATTFGVALSATNPSGKSATAYIDTAQIVVYYTLGAGFTTANDAVVYANKTTEVRWDGAYRSADNVIYGVIPGRFGPDQPRIPPSGMEARVCQLFVRPSRGDLRSLSDSGLDSMSVQVIWRPCWMGRP